MSDIRPLSVGMVVDAGTPQARQWRESLRAVATALGAVSGAQDGDGPELEVNVVFQVPPGADLPLEFSGVRTGRLDRRARVLVVQVAVPFDVPADAPGFMWDGITAAIDVAEEHARRKGIASDLTSARTMRDEARAASGGGA